MAFGQPAGRPASHSKVRELLELVEQAGHADFRDARGALGLTQRQAGGKFTADEAEALIQELQEAAWAAEAETEAGDKIDTENDGGKSEPKAKKGAVKPIPKPSQSRVGRELRKYKDQDLAAELQRRGWVVLEP